MICWSPWLIIIGLLFLLLLISAMKRAVVTCSRPDMGVVLLLKGGWCSVCRAAKLDGGVTPIKYFSSTFLLGVAPVVK